MDVRIVNSYPSKVYTPTKKKRALPPLFFFSFVAPKCRFGPPMPPHTGGHVPVAADPGDQKNRVEGPRGCEPNALAPVFDIVQRHIEVSQCL